MQNARDTTTAQYSKDSADDEHPFLARIGRLFKDPEVKKWRARRYQELKKESERQQFYDSTKKLIKETREIAAENRNYLRACPPISSTQKIPSIRQILCEENLPFEIKDGQFNYTGPPGELYNSSFDLESALVDRAPEVLEGSIGDIEFLNATVPGFNDAWNKECYRLRQKNVLVENRIMRSDGVLTDKGEDMLTELYGDKSAWSFTNDKNAYTVIPLLPTLITLVAKDGREADELCKKTFDHLFGEEKRAASEARLKEIAGEEDKRPWYRSGLRKAAALAGAGLMVFGAVAGMAGGDDDAHDASHVVKDLKDPGAHSRDTGFNADAYDYNRTLDELHPITKLLGTDDEDRLPALYEDKLVFSRRFDNGSWDPNWTIHFKNLTTGKEHKLFEIPYAYGFRPDITIYGERVVVEGPETGYIHNLTKKETNSYDSLGRNPDIWGDKIVTSRANDAQTSNINLIKLRKDDSIREVRWLTNERWGDDNGQEQPTIFKDEVVWWNKTTETYWWMNITTEESKNLGIEGNFSGSVDLFGDKLVVEANKKLYELKNGTVKSNRSFGKGYMEHPSLYGSKLLWSDNGDIYMMELDKWLPQITNMPDELTLIEDHPFYYKFNVSDPDTPYNLRPYATFNDNGTGPWFWPGGGKDRWDFVYTPTAEDVGTRYLYILVDGYTCNNDLDFSLENMAMKRCKFTVLPNNSPVFTDLPDLINVRVPAKNGTSGYPFQFSGHLYDICASDEDGDNFTYSFRKLVDIPEIRIVDEEYIQRLYYGNNSFWLNKTSGRLWGSGSFIMDETYEPGLRIAVSDGIATTIKETHLHFDRNNPPRIMSWDPNADTLVKYEEKYLSTYKRNDEPFILEVEAYDQEDDFLDFRLEAFEKGKGFMPVGTVNVTNYVNAKFRWQPNASILAKCRYVIGDGFDETISDEFLLNYTKTVPDNNQTEINNPPTFVDLPERIDVRVPSRYKNTVNATKISFWPESFDFYNVEATDDDGDAISYGLLPTKDFPYLWSDGRRIYGNNYSTQGEWSWADGAIEIDSITGKLAANGTLLDNAFRKEPYQIKVTASDGKATVNKTVDVIFKLNHKPTINSIYPAIPKDKVYKVVEDRTLDLGFVVSDPDGDALTTRLEVMNGAQFLTVATAEKGVHTWEDGGILRWDPSGMLKSKCRIVVSDGLDETYSGEFSVDYVSLNKIKSECPPGDYGPDMPSPAMEPGPGANIPPDSCIKESTSSQWNLGGATANFLAAYWAPLTLLAATGAATSTTYKGVRAWQRARRERFEKQIRDIMKMRWELEYNGRTKPKRKRRVTKARKKARKK